MNTKARLIAFYLPQFHPVPENDKFWGKGFTEWTNVAKAKPLFKGHSQPKFPGELGFYDLRVPEVREQQAELAREHGIEGFCYWHYWFGNGKRVLERPFNEVLASGKPDFPFCLGWANETWSGRWHGLNDQIIIEQKYPGKEDYTKHFYAMLPAFEDKRYIRVNNKPLFLIYSPKKLPDAQAFVKTWQTAAKKEGLPGIHFVACAHPNEHKKNKHIFDKFVRTTPNSQILNVVPSSFIGKLFYRLCKRIFHKSWKNLMSEKGITPLKCKYDSFVSFFINKKIQEDEYPVVVPNWDNTPRCGKRGTVLVDCSPQKYETFLKAEIEKIQQRSPDEKIIFIKSWNEWAEGNYIEPDAQFGEKYLEATFSAIS